MAKGINTKIGDKEVEISCDVELKKIHVVEKKKSRKEWELEADTTEVFNQEKTTLLQCVKLKFYPKNQKELTVLAKNGKFNNETKNMEVYGDVVVSSEEGYSLKTDSLKWVSNKRVIETDDPVVITNRGLKIKGKGLFSEIDKHSLMIKSDVKAVFDSLN
jgi:LPS export ABC transporter protein LptC